MTAFDDMKKKFDMGAAVNFRLPEVYQPDYSQLIKEVDANIEAINRASAEKVRREKETVELLRGILEVVKESPAAQQYIQTLIQNSTIQNMQNIQPGATGIQNITNNTGIQVEEILKLLGAIRELSDVFAPDRAEEVNEVVDDLEQEVLKPDAKKGRIKASLTYLKTLFTKVVGEPIKSVAKAQFTKYAQEDRMRLLA